MIYRLIYRSRFRPETGGVSGVLHDLLTVSQRNNARDGITGYLLFDRTHFVQILEGGAAAVEQTFGRIAGDRRHHEIAVLVRRQTEARAFPDWSMGGFMKSPESEYLYERHGCGRPGGGSEAAPETWVALARDIAAHDVARHGHRGLSGS